MNAPRRHDAGFTIVEMLTVLLISSILFVASLGSFTQLSRTSNDHEQKVIAQLQAQSVIDMMTPELRMLGNGVPFHQPNFLIGQATLTDTTVTEPILVAGTTAEQVQFRLNETGETYILTATFNPAVHVAISLTSTNKIFAGDEIYITNSTIGADDGLWGKVTNVAGNTVTIAMNSQYTPGAIFEKGSLLEVVPIITYRSIPDFGGITRDDGTGPLVLVSGAQFTLHYLDVDGAEMALPLISAPAEPYPASAIQNVRSIKMTVQVRSQNRLTTGQYYVATAEQTVGIRNLNYKY